MQSIERDIIRKGKFKGFTSGAERGVTAGVREGVTAGLRKGQTEEREVEEAEKGVIAGVGK